MTPREIAYHEKLDHFAELLSLNLEMPVIRQRMGISGGGAWKLMKTLTDKYGWQAK